MAPITIDSPAKINLNLKITGKRQDGYHLLDSIMCKLQLADEITVDFSNPSGEDQLCVHEDTKLKLDDNFYSRNNLILRALDEFRKKCGWPLQGIKIIVKKRIPLGAGLGGGSSNCAAILSTLNSYSPRGLSSQQLAELGLSLGADVPFFLWPAAIAQVNGIGEILSPPPEDTVTWRNKSIILIKPDIFLSTGKIFQTLGLTNSSANNNLGPMYASFTAGENDLLVPALRLVPELKQIIDTCKSVKDAQFGLSGSGPTFWLHCPQPDEAFERISAADPLLEVWITKIL